MIQNHVRYQKAKRVTVTTAVANLVLTLLKIVFGTIGHSQALVADGLNSFSDLAVDGIVIFATKTSHQAPDQMHPYGHGRIETVFTLGLALLLALVGLGIAADSLYHLLTHTNLGPPHFITAIIALISIMTNEFIFRTNLHVSKQIHSNLLKANAWHHRSDALSSLVVLIGILGAKLGIHFMDTIAAIFVAALILKMAFQLMKSNIQDLIDTSIDLSLRKKIEDEILTIPDVKAAHALRSRLVGNSVFLDAHIEVDPNITVSEGHFIADQVSKHLAQSFPQIADVVVHVDIEPDDFRESSQTLPNRQELTAKLRSLWEALPESHSIQRVNLHYRNDKIDIELVFPFESLCSKDQDLKKKYQESLSTLPYIHSIKFLGEI